MQLITAFINNPVKVAVSVLLLVLFGVIAVFQMPVELTPRVEKQWLSITTYWPGAGPEEVERQIVYEQERQLNAVPGMKYISSTSSNSRARVTLEFDTHTDMSEALVKVDSRLQQVSRYPETALEPTIYSGTDDSAEIAIFSVIPRPPDDEQLVAFAALHPDLAEVIGSVRKLFPPTVQLEQLQRLARRHTELEELLPRDVDIASQSRFIENYVAAAIGRVPGVARVWAWGGKLEEMRVVVDPAMLAVLNLTLTDIRDTLREHNHDAPAGQMNSGKRRYDVRVIGRYTSPQQIKQEVITVVNGMPVTIGDVANVELAFRSERDSASRHFSTTSLRIGVTKEPGANLLEVMKGIRRVRDELNDVVLRRRGLLLHQSYDDTEYVASSIRSVQLNMLLGAVLTAVVLLIFLRNLRSTLIVGLAIPVSIVGTFLCLRMLGRSLNVVSLAGMSFAIGMLVDNAVVVLENIFRHYQDGFRPVEAARRGTLEVWGATLASTLTTLAVFVPILFVREEAGQLFKDIALAISCGVGLSLLVSVIVIPTAAARLLRHETDEASVNHGRQLRHDAGGSVDDSGAPSRHSLLSLILLPVDVSAAFVSRYIIWLTRRIQSSLPLQLASVAFFVGGAVALAVFLMPSVEYLPNGNRNSVRGRLVPPSGYNVEQVQTIGDELYDRVQRSIQQRDSQDGPSKYDSEVPEIVDYTFSAYNGRGYISAKAREPARAHELVDFLRAMSESIPGVDAYVSQVGLFQDGWGSSSRQIEVHITGPDLHRLVALGKTVQGLIQEAMPESTAYPSPALEMGKPELRVVPNKLRVAEAGLSTDDIAYTVDAFIDAAYADKYLLDGDEIDLSVAVRNPSVGEQSLDDVPISTPGGDIVPLAALADLTVASGLDSVRHINRERAVSLFVTPPDGIALADALRSIEEKVIAPLEARGELDGWYRIALSGTADKLRDTWSALWLKFLIAILITYLLMAALFESWSSPLVIMVALPLAAVGGIVGLRIVGLFTTQHLDILTMLGFVILVGTVVNNAILIVHQALNYMRQHEMHPDDAVVRSVATRIRPIFMTTITTTCGLLPLVVVNGAGSELYRGMGSVVLGGLVVSTVFTLFLVPSLFSLMHSATAGIGRIRRRGRPLTTFTQYSFEEGDGENAAQEEIHVRV